MNKYKGQIKTKSQALALAKKLREENGSTEAIDASKMLERNWEYFASRPSIQPRLIALANTTPLSRKGGIMDTILNG